MSDQQVSVSRTIAAAPEDIFAVVADARRHHEFDGSDTVVGAADDAPERLTLGSRFGMKMKMVVPYDMRSEVVEYGENELIAWQHVGKHRWRYEFAPVDGGTRVTETFDWSTSRFPWLIELLRYPKKHPKSMAKTLERLEQVVTA